MLYMKLSSLQVRPDKKYRAGAFFSPATAVAGKNTVNFISVDVDDDAC